MLRFFKSENGYFHRIIGYPIQLKAIAHIHCTAETQNAEITRPCMVQGSHPWPEWLELMSLLVKKGYIEEDINPLGNGGKTSKEFNHIRTACLNFARHRFTLVRSLSRKDIKVIVGCGCPSIDRKVVNSGKRLRAYLAIDEGKVCGSCNLRGECERAYAQAREEEGARTVDVMRILLTYGLDTISSTVENRACQTKLVEDSVRKLLRESVEYSLKDLESTDSSQDEILPCSQGTDQIDTQKKPGDWHCPECKFLNFARNIRCLRCDIFSVERLKQLKEEQKDHLPLKKGDWICVTCNFLNFAKNTICLRCKDKPSMRQINPGEWECESCNYINFRRNSVCLKCDHRRTKASKTPPETHTQQNKDTTSGGGYNGGTKTWSFVEGESEKTLCGNREEEDEFMGFPVEGGRGNVSRSIEKREKWKLEMMQRTRSDGAEVEVEVEEEEKRERRYYEKRRAALLGNSSDDGEMEEWFVSKDDRLT